MAELTQQSKAYINTLKEEKHTFIGGMCNCKDLKYFDKCSPNSSKTPMKRSKMTKDAR